MTLNITEIDNWLDDGAGQEYQDQPLAQDWARVGKVIEELGEAISELISFTGQNPRKPQSKAAKDKMLKELADVVCTGTLAIQHFTKDEILTYSIIAAGWIKVSDRVPQIPAPYIQDEL